MRFIDEIRTRHLPLSPDAIYVPPAEWESFDWTFRRALDDIPVIIADNVDSFCLDRFGLGERATEITLADEFPNAVPPFPRFWVEWTPAASQLRQLFDRYAALVTGVRTDDGWDIEIMGVLRPVGRRVALISVRNCIAHSSALGECQTLNTSLLDMPGLKPSEKDMWDFFLSVPLMTMCFMNCRNVIVNQLAVPSQPLQKAFQRRHGISLSRRVHTIEITPMTRFLPPKGASESKAHHRATAAHICRGHFKHYGEDAKLFGRVTGTFFWGAQLRSRNGDRDVSADYKINTKGKPRRPA